MIAGVFFADGCGSTGSPKTRQAASVIRTGGLLHTAPLAVRRSAPRAVGQRELARRARAFVVAVGRVLTGAASSAVLVGAYAFAAAAQAAGPAPTAPPVFAGIAVRGAVAADEATAVADELRRLFAERGAHVIVQAARTVVEQRQQRDLGAMDARLDDAARALAAGDAETAREDVKEAIRMFEEALAFAEDDAAWARYREALLLQATVLWKLRDKLGADGALLQLLAVEPEWKPKRGTLPADLLARIELVRDDARSTPTATLEVKSRPAGARVLIDGRRAGRAPVAVDVAPGIHYVLVEDAGRIHRERVVVAEAGARVSARLGSPEMEAAAALVRQLRAPATPKRQLLELAWDVADVTVVAVVLPWGGGSQVVCARVVEGELAAVVGAIVPRAEAPRAQALFTVVDAALTRAKDAWVGKDAARLDAALLRDTLLQGQGDIDAAIADDGGGGGPSIPLIVGGVVGAAAVVGGIALGVVTWLGAEDEKERGFRYAVDGSGLASE